MVKTVGSELVARQMTDIIRPIQDSGSKASDVMRMTNGDRPDFCTFENEIAARGRRYHRIVIDEAAFTKDGHNKCVAAPNIAPFGVKHLTPAQHSNPELAPALMPHWAGSTLGSDAYLMTALRITRCRAIVLRGGRFSRAHTFVV
jgi:hypothetical protein